MADIDDLLLGGLALDRTYKSDVEAEWAAVGLTVKLTRNVKDYAYTHDTGTEIYNGPASVGMFVDDAIPSVPRVYYYTLWYDDGGVWKTDPILKSHVLVVEMGSFIEIVKDRLIPRMYHAGWEVMDTPESLAALVSLVLIPSLEELRNLAKALTVIIDIDEAPGSVLPGFARLLGLEPNTELTIRQQRDEIKQIFYIWKGKGTVDVVNIICNVVAGILTAVDEWGDNVFITNMANEYYDLTSPYFTRYNRVTADPADPDFGEAGRAGDKRSYTIESVEEGNKYNYLDYGVYIPIEDTYEFSGLQARKIIEKLELLSPLGSRGNVILVGESQEEVTLQRLEQVDVLDYAWP